MTTSIDRKSAATVHGAWCVTCEHGVIVCSTRATAERVAQLIDRHGIVDAPLSMPPDPFVNPDAPVTPLVRVPWFVRLLGRWGAS